MKPYRTIDEVLSDRRKGTNLSEVVENILHSPYVLEQLETPFDVVGELQKGDYLDASTTAWGSLPVELQIKYASEYQSWYAYHSGHQSVEALFDLVPGVKTLMIFVPPMKYIMGSDNHDVDPKHPVLIEKSAWLGKCEVTQQEWKSVMREPYSSPPLHREIATLPVTNVNWNECKEFCKKTGMKLPHEELWEMACRAGTTTMFSFGNDIADLENYAWYSENSDHQTHPVGQLKANAWGLRDMLGNVWEWCDNRAKFFDYTFDDIEALGRKPKDYVNRGGSYLNPFYCSSSGYRNADDFEHSSSEVGFRIWCPD